jgi:hypothetical protein
MEPLLTTFLVGKFNRRSIHDVLEGMTIADISGVVMEDFLSALQQKDRLIGTRLWVDVLYPLRSQWKEWRPQYNAIELARCNLLRAYTSAQQPPNNQQA